MRIVKYLGCCDAQVRFGANDDPRGVLEVGEVYFLEQEEIRSSSTKFKLKDIPGKFNSVCFKDLGEAGGIPTETINHYKSLTI